MITLELIHLIAFAGLGIAAYGKLFMEIQRNLNEINDLKARIRECERRWEELGR